MSLTDVNFVAVIIGAIINIAIGMFWYSPALFGKEWAEAHGFKLDHLRPTPPHYVGAIIVSLIIAWALALLINYLQITTVSEGMKLAALVWFGFVATTHFSGVIWAQKPIKSYLIDTGCLLVTMLIMGAIFAVWK
jgi:hypothetical protein